MHRMISDFFPSLVTCCPSSAIHHFCFFFSFIFFLAAPSLLSSYHPIPGFVRIHHLQPHFLLFFTSVGPPLFSFCPTKHVSMSPEKQKRSKEIHVTRDTKNTPTGAQVSGLVHIIICLLSPLIFPSCHLCFMVKTNF